MRRSGRECHDDEYGRLGEVKLPEANDQLKKARESAASSVVPGERMSRHELAERVNAWVFDSTGETVSLDAHYIAKLERGVIRWPRSAYRDALRAVLGASTNLDLGLRPRRTGEVGSRPGMPLSPGSTSAGLLPRNGLGSPVEFRSDRDSRSFGASAAPVFGESDAAAESGRSRTFADNGLAAVVAESVAESVALGRREEASDLGPATLEQIDLAVAQFGRTYPHVPPGELFPAVRDYRSWATGFLDGRLTLTQRSRLCWVAGWLSGLLGRLSLDLGDRTAASAHCLTAAQLATETGDSELATCVRDTQAMIDAPAEPTDPADPAGGSGRVRLTRRPEATMPGTPWRSAAPVHSFATSGTRGSAPAPRAGTDANSRPPMSPPSADPQPVAGPPPWSPLWCPTPRNGSATPEKKGDGKSGAARRGRYGL
jgi:hypothetical protein